MKKKIVKYKSFFFLREKFGFPLPKKLSITKRLSVNLLKNDNEKKKICRCF